MNVLRVNQRSQRDVPFFFFVRFFLLTECILNTDWSVQLTWTNSFIWLSRERIGHLGKQLFLFSVQTCGRWASDWGGGTTWMCTYSKRTWLACLWTVERTTTPKPSTSNWLMHWRNSFSIECGMLAFWSRDPGLFGHSSLSLPLFLGMTLNNFLIFFFLSIPHFCRRGR